MTLVLVRHGNTFAAGEVPRRIGVRTDLPLVPSGRAQADALGRHFAGQRWGFSRVLTAPSRRCRETAATILTHQAQVPEAERCAWLAEIDHGPDEDRPEADVIARLGPQALAAWDEQAAAPPGWTVDRDERIGAWRSLIAEEGHGGADRMILLVTSNGAARFALLADPALAAAAATLATLKLRTGAYGRIALERRGGARLLDWDVRPA